MRNQPTTHGRDEWDDDTRTYRGYDKDDELAEERPYTAAENTSADADANRATLSEQGLAALAANLADIATNDGALSVVSPTNALVVGQVRELTRQSSRQAKQLNTLIRLVLKQLDETT